MKVASPDITKALVAELKALHERHQQFRTRVKAADEAASKRDEEARKQNAVLTQRIATVENELKRAKESVEALRQFIDLLPGVKSDFDSFEDEIEAFEAVGSDYSGLEYVASATERVDVLENGVRGILDVGQDSDSHSSDLLDGISATSDDFSLSGDSTNDHPAVLANTNNERLELILELYKQPLKDGDVWFLILTSWFEGWKMLCKEKPDQIGTEYARINTSALLDSGGKLVESQITTPGKYPGPSCMTVPLVAWNHLANWYGCDSLHLPRLVMPDTNSTLGLHVQQRAFNLFCLLPPGAHTQGDFTPQIVVSKGCAFKALRSIVVNSLPCLPMPHSIEFYVDIYPKPYPMGWSTTHFTANKALLSVDTHADSAVHGWGANSFIVSIKVLDETTGCMVPFDPFPHPTSPPRILTWTPACA